MRHYRHLTQRLTRRLSVLVCASGLTFLASFQLHASEPPRLDFSGFFFGDLYYIPSHHTAEGDGASGGVLRRLLLTADATLDDHWSARARLEAYHEGAFENYEMTHRVLDLGVTRKLGDHRLSAGLIPTITYDVMEGFWGKRYLVRTAPDIQGIAARDLGVKLMGPLSSGRGLSYRVMYGSKETWEADKNPFDKVMGGVTWWGNGGWLVDAYGDWESRPGPYDRRTWQFLVGKKTDQYTLGLEYLNQDRDEDPDLELATVLGVLKLGGRWSLMGQLHRLFKPSVKGNDIAYIPFDPTAKATNLVGGLEYRVNEHVTLSPNIVWTRYSINESGVKPDDDLHLRLTFYVNFE
ncbi:MAG: hypothetical protein EBY62_00930 [Cellvibrionales bacterium]|nr:hypothetical protein [Cellvibrionales bacterium]